LGRKLAAGGPGDISAETLQESHLPPDAAANQARIQVQPEVEALVQKARELSHERHTLKSETAAVDEHYAVIIRDLKSELEAAQLQYSEMRGEQACLRQKLAGDNAEHQSKQGDL